MNRPIDLFSFCFGGGFALVMAWCIRWYWRVNFFGLRVRGEDE